MSEEHRERDYTEELVHKYEQMLAKQQSLYFDIDELEEIIDYYCDENRFHKAIRVIEYGYVLFPENTTMLLREGQILSAMGHLNKALARLKLLEKIESNNEEMLLTMS